MQKDKKVAISPCMTLIMPAGDQDEELKRNQIEIGIDKGGLYFEAGSESAAYAFIEGLLAMENKELQTELVEYELSDAMALVVANNKAQRMALKPLANCPNMVMPSVCNICFWHNPHTDRCHGG